MRRVTVIGSSGSGKSTFGAALAARLGVPHVELDSLFWGPNWTAARDSPEGLARFRGAVGAATAGDGWVVDGNYSDARDLVWPRADTIVWLDLPLPLALYRVLKRTLRRVFTRELLWGTNRERFRDTFFTKDALVWYVLRTHRARRRRFAEQLAAPELASVRVVRLCTSGQVDEWLGAIGSARENAERSAASQASV